MVDRDADDVVGDFVESREDDYMAVCCRLRDAGREVSNYMVGHIVSSFMTVWVVSALFLTQGRESSCKLVRFPQQTVGGFCCTATTPLRLAGRRSVAVQRILGRPAPKISWSSDLNPFTVTLRSHPKIIL